MKTWQEFNDTVNDLLLVDGLRKGRGVEKFRDRMIVAGVRDLMAYIPELRTTPTEETFTKGDELPEGYSYVPTPGYSYAAEMPPNGGVWAYGPDGSRIEIGGRGKLELHGENQCMVGQFDVESARVLDVIVRQLPEDDGDISKYYRLHIYPAYKRHTIFDGGHSKRSASYPGKISFDRGQFYTAPVLEDNEILSILYNQEYVYKPLFEATTEQKAYKTNLGDDAALAVHYFVKYHFMKDVNDDASQAQTNLQNYQRERRKIAVNKPEVLSTQNPVESLDQGGGFLLGG